MSIHLGTAPHVYYYGLPMSMDSEQSIHAKKTHAAAWSNLEGTVYLEKH